MSVRVSDYVWSHSRQKGGALLVLLAIAGHADDDGLAYPGLPLLVAETRLSERAVRYALRQLEASGELRTDIGRGRGHRTTYRLVGIKGAVVAPSEGIKGATTAPLNGRKGAVCDTEKGQFATVKGAICDRPVGGTIGGERTVIEPSREPSPPLPPTPPPTMKKPTYAVVLDGLFPEIATDYQSLDRDLGKAWLRMTLVALEPDIGSLSREQLRAGLAGAFVALRRRLEAERDGGKPIGALRPYAKAMIVARLQEAKEQPDGSDA